MLHFPYLTKKDWPFVPLQNTLFEYFSRTKCCTNSVELTYFIKRETLLNALKSNPDFSESWTIFQEQHPTNKDYFLSLTKEGQPFDSRWIWKEYKTYLERKAFDELSEEGRRKLQNEYDELRPAAYRVALEGEALRLSCDVSEVRPKSLVLPWQTDNDEESLIVHLPNEIFGRILSELDMIDVFRMTLVCRRWKNLIHNNAQHLKRAEHALTTHMITFTEWMDPPKTPNCQTFFRQYQLFTWCLVKWYCGISENLETLILDHPVPYVYLAMLLKSCPVLKRLQIANNRDAYIPTYDLIHAKVHMKHLEVFLYSNWDFPIPYGGSMPSRNLHRDVLVSSESLRAFRGSLNMEDCSFVNAQKPLSIVFRMLIALDLNRFTASAIELLAQIDDLQLKYLRFGYHEYRVEWDVGLVEGRTRDAFHQLLSKLDRLEILITSTNAGITNDTIQLLVDLELNLSFAVLYHAYFYAENEHDLWDPSIEIDPLQPDVLIAFQDMLLSKNPAINLSDIHFVLVEGKMMDSLEAVETGFTFHRMFDDSWEASLRTELYHPQMQQRLGIDL